MFKELFESDEWVIYDKDGNLLKGPMRTYSEAKKVTISRLDKPFYKNHYGDARRV